MILDTKKIASSILQELSQKIQLLITPPTIGVILIGDESTPSLRYIKQKRRSAKKVGIEFKLCHLPKSTSQEELISQILLWNHDDSISGYLVQLPLPEHIKPQEIISAITPQKDVDGFHPENQGKIVLGDDSGLPPCTPAGIMKILEHYDISLRGKTVCVLGQSNIVGKPMAQMCINAGATVTSCNADTPDISLYTKNCDVLISATGVPHLISGSMVSSHTLIIDVGFTFKDGKIYGDVDQESVLANGNRVTPVPGGVGPMTVAMLLQNTYAAHVRKS